MTAKEAVKTYQCPGCMKGPYISCYKQNTDGIGCASHIAGTLLPIKGKIFLGLPKGFCRLGFDTEMKPIIYEKYIHKEHAYDMYNIPVWKHVNKQGHTIVRGMMPRLNQSFIHIYLENCSNKIECLEITNDHINGMD